MNCTGKRCIMQYDKVDPATCTAVPYCPQATPPKTNADHIRCMTDAELAEWFCTMCNFGDFCPYKDDCDTNGSGVLKWLKEEAKHET